MGAENNNAALVSHHINFGAVELGQHVRLHNLVGGTNLILAMRQIDNPVHVVRNWVEVVRDKNHSSTLLLGLIGDQATDNLLVVQIQSAQWFVCQN